MSLRLVFLAACIAIGLTSFGQLLSWSPQFVKENENITITLDATKGNQGLNNFSGDVYVHIGAITTESSSGSDWKYVPFTWGTSPANGKVTSIGNNKWTYTITNVRSFFNVTNVNEKIKAIAILFRSADGNTVHRNADGTDMYVPIFGDTLATWFTAPAYQPKYEPTIEPLDKAVGDDLLITAHSNQAANLKLYLNNVEIASVNNATTISHTATISAAGNNSVKIEAIKDGNSTYKEFSFFASSGVTVAPLPAGVRDGINYHSGTEATLVLYAPGKERVNVIGEFPGNNWQQQVNYTMNVTPDGKYWWLRLTGLTAGEEYAYQYLVDGNLKIADPYAEKILDPWNDQYISNTTYPNLKPYPAGQTGIVSVLQTNAPGYTWRVQNFARPDKRSLVTYELLVRDFVAAHDWKTVKDSIPYFKKLGINAIELMPFNEFEGNESWGYNPDFYFASDKYYGTKNALKDFIDACHENGIAVIMDIALNHAFGLSPMVQLYWDAANNRPAADNPWFNPVPKHAFNVGFDFNHQSEATQYFFKRVVEHWLQEYKLDGFRFDLSKGFTQNQTCDNNGGNCNVDAWGNYDAARVALWKKYYDTLQVKSAGSYAILEHFAANDEEKELANYGLMFWGNSNHAYNEATMGYIPNSNFNSALHTVRGWNQPHLMSYMESHDEERLMYKNAQFGNASGAYNTKEINTALKRMELAASFFLTMPGPKMIWQFGEMGYDFSINHCPDNTISDACRTSNKPIRWDYLNNPNRKALWNVYSELNRLRQRPEYKDIFIANNTTLTHSFEGAMKSLVLRSANDTSALYVVGNFGVSSNTAAVSFPFAGKWYEYFTNDTLTVGTNAIAMNIEAGGYRVFINRNINNVPDNPMDPIDPTDPTVVVGNRFLVSVLNNPVNSTSVLRMNVSQDAQMNAVLYDMQGRTQAIVFNQLFSRGIYSISLAPYVNKLSSGIYLLKVHTQQKEFLFRLVKQ